MKTYTVGIDFGTTKTLVAYYDDEEDKPVIAHLGRERNSIPTSAFLSEDGTWLFGEDADDQAYDEQQIDRYATAFKLLLGSPSPALQLFTPSGLQSFTALELTAKFLEHVRILCENEVFNGHKVTEAVITHPAMFGPAQVEDLRMAAQRAGFDKVRLMREPEAAGLAFCELCPQEAFTGTALAVDWGGGTLDLALVSRNVDGAITVQDRYTAGSNTLGGNFLDEFIWKDAQKKLKAKGEDIAQDPAHIQLAQKKRVRLLKERLSKMKTGRLILPGELGPHIALEYAREDLERIIRPEICKGIREVSHLLQSIKTSSLIPDQALLIGGSSQIPLISKLITDNTGIACKRWQYSHEAVAMGAALSADEHGDDEKKAEPSEYYVSVGAQQFRTGATLSATIEGVKIRFRVQPHSKAGTEILLPAEQTKGLGPLRLILINRADNKPQTPKSAEERGKEDKPSVHRVLVGAQPLMTGATLSVTIKGVKIEFRVQPHTKVGTEILLPAEQTKGLGPLRLILTNQVDNKHQSPKSAEERGKEAKPSVHRVLVGAQQLLTGATVSVTIKGVKIEFRVQPHTKVGTEILLPAEQTKGLGPLRLILVNQVDNKPQSPKSAGDRGKEAKPPVYRVSVGAQQLLTGARVSVTIKGVKIEFRVQPHTKEGTEILLPAEQTKGLGPLRLILLY